EHGRSDDEEGDQQGQHRDPVAGRAVSGEREVARVVVFAVHGRLRGFLPPHRTLTSRFSETTQPLSPPVEPVRRPTGVPGRRDEPPSLRRWETERETPFLHPVSTSPE